MAHASASYDPLTESGGASGSASEREILTVGGLIVAGIAIIALLYYFVIAKAETIPQGILTGAGNSIMDAALAAGKTITQILTDGEHGISQSITSGEHMISDTASGIGNAADKIASGAAGTLSQIAGGIGVANQQVTAGIGQAWHETTNGVGSFASSVTSGISKDATGIASGVGGLVAGGVASATEAGTVISGHVGEVSQDIQQGGDTIYRMGGDAYTAITNTASNDIGAISDVVWSGIVLITALFSIQYIGMAGIWREMGKIKERLIVLETKFQLCLPKAPE